VTKRRTKRPNLPQEALERARAELRGEITEAAVEMPSDATPSARAKRTTTSTTPAYTQSRRVPTIDELRKEYAHVRRDLRKLFVLSGVLLAVILVAALVLPPIVG
jgi:hypothetical protein